MRVYASRGEVALGYLSPMEFEESGWSAEMVNTWKAMTKNVRTCLQEDVGSNPAPATNISASFGRFFVALRLEDVAGDTYGLFPR